MKASASAALRLLPVPLLLLAAALATLESRGPFWLGTNSDPSYVYALNSLRVAEGHAPTHLDHPGLTVQLLGAAVFRASHRLSHRTEPIVDDALARPETYLRTTARTFLVLFAGSLFLLGLAVFALTKRWSLAWTTPLGPLLSPSVLFELTDVKPEPILYLIAVLLAAAVGAALAVGDPDRSPFPATFGALVGLAIATKLTALPLLVCPLVLHRTWRARLVCGLSAAGAFVLCALPAWPNWRLGARFVWRLSSGTGLYGVAVLADGRPYFDQWKRLGVEEAPFLLILALALALLLRERRAPAGTAPAGVLRAVVAVFATGVARLALVAKHPYQPRYLVPALALGGLLPALLPYVLRPSGIGRADRAAVVVAVLSLAALQVPRFFEKGRAVARRHRMPDAGAGTRRRRRLSNRLLLSSLLSRLRPLPCRRRIGRPLSRSPAPVVSRGGLRGRCRAADLLRAPGSPGTSRRSAWPCKAQPEVPAIR